MQVGPCGASTGAIIGPPRIALAWRRLTRWHGPKRLAGLRSTTFWKPGLAAGCELAPCTRRPSAVGRRLASCERGLSAFGVGLATSGFCRLPGGAASRPEEPQADTATVAATRAIRLSARMLNPPVDTGGGHASQRG